MLKAFKVRLYPNTTQRIYFAKAIGCARAIYNMMLHDYNEALEQFRKDEASMTDDEKKKHKFTHKPNYSGYAKQSETSYLKEIEARALNYVQQNLKGALDKFFKGRKKGVGKPVYKKKTSEGSFQSDKIQVIGNKLKVPKCTGLVQFRNYTDVDFSKLKTKKITISRNCAGHYFASILCEVPDVEPLPKTGKAIGIDLGVACAVTMDDGTKLDRISVNTEKKTFRGKERGTPAIVKTIREKIAFYQAKMMKAGVWCDVTFIGQDGKEHVKRKLVQESGNYRRYKQKVANLTEKLYNIRNNYVNNVAKKVIESADVICMEDLKIKNGMLNDDDEKTNKQNATSHRNIAEASMGMIAQKIDSMANTYGRVVQKVDPHYTSITCNCCGTMLREKLATSIREWTCPKCGTHHDRDVNAAKNILKLGLTKLEENTKLKVEK